MRTGAETPSTSSEPDTGGEIGGSGAGFARSQAAASRTHEQRLSTLRAMAIKDGLLAEYDHEMGTTRRLLERLPDEKLTWKPHEKSMALGELACHLGNIPNWAGTILNDASFDLANAPPNQTPKASRAEILALFDESTKKTRALMDKSDAEYMAPWSLKRGGQNWFSMPRIAAFRSFVLNHTIHHRGQLSVYLRLNEIPVPPIYGPTADEG
jgi:uncharacterized damage-inducible protein DinB